MSLEPQHAEVEYYKENSDLPIFRWAHVGM